LVQLLNAILTRRNKYAVGEKGDDYLLMSIPLGDTGAKLVQPETTIWGI